MLMIMQRSQRTRLGLLRSGVAYTFDKAKHADVIDRLLEKKFAKKTTEKALKQKAIDLAAQEAEQMVDASDGSDADDETGGDE